MSPRLLLLGLLVLAPHNEGDAGIGQTQAPPAIAATSLPMYPPLARAARVEGVVHVRIRTDGTRAVSARAEDGAQLLAQSAEANALTWRFQVHGPTELVLTYTYRIDSALAAEELVVRLHYPLHVDVSTAPLVVRDVGGDAAGNERK